MSQEYWFNIKTKTVEVGKQSLSLDRIGPFATYEEAARGEQIIADKAQELREEDLED